jgi:hypothetical protein
MNCLKIYLTIFLADFNRLDFKSNSDGGEPLWLRGKVMEWKNKQNQKIPGSLPARATFKK